MSISERKLQIEQIRRQNKHLFERTANNSNERQSIDSKVKRGVREIVDELTFELTQNKLVNAKIDLNQPLGDFLMH